LTRTREKRPAIGNIIAALALVLSLVGLVWNRCQDEDIRREQYMKAALEARPILEPCGPVRVESAYARLDSVRPIADTARFYLSHLSLKMTIPVINSREEPAQVYNALVADMREPSSELRDYVLDRPVKRKPTRIQEVGFSPTVAAGDTIDLIAHGEIEVLDSVQGTVMHILILYENDAAMLFDSYLCVPLRTFQGTWKNPNRVHQQRPSQDSVPRPGTIVALPDWVIESKGTVRNLHVYTPAEAKVVRRKVSPARR